MKNHLYIKDNGRIYYPALSEIMFIKSAGNYCQVYFNNHRPMLLTSMDSLLKKLPQHFFKIHREVIVNLNYTLSVYLGTNEWVIELTTGQTFNISRRQILNLEKYLKNTSI